MNPKSREEASVNNDLKRFIKTITHTGEKKLDSRVLKDITKICKKSNEYVIHAYHLLIEHLGAKHSEIRFSAFQLCDELFRRSHCFREVMVANLQLVLEFTVETEASAPLPPPKAAAKELKKLALSTITEWCKVYGTGYKKLNLAISFLKQCKKVDLNAMALEQAAEQSRQEECERRRKAIYSEHYKKTLNEIVEKRPDIVSSITELESCLSLLLPTPDSFFIEEEILSSSESVIKTDTSVDGNKVKENITANQKDQSNASSESEGDSEDDSEDDEANATGKNKIFDFRKYGIINPQISLKLNLDVKNNPIIKETEENRDIIQNAREAYKILSGKYSTCLDKWITTINKYQEVSGNACNLDVTSLTRLKERLTTAVSKFDQLNLGNVTADPTQDDSDDGTSDSDFEEVEGKAGYEQFAKSSAVAADPSSVIAAKPKKMSKKDWSLLSEENNEKDPTTALSTLSSLKPKKQKLMDLKIKKEDDSDELTHKKKSGDVKIKKEDDSDELINKTPKKDDEPIAGSSGMQQSKELERKSKLLSIAPKLPFDIDLYHWEDEKVTAPTMLSVKPDTHRFWSSAAEELEDVLDPDGEAALRTRVIEFAGQFEPVKWACRAPLPSGNLCPRKDRVKCPLHGRIVGRDDKGVPTDPADRDAEKDKEAKANAEKIPDWQDPVLLAQLKESTGVDLRMPDKSKRGWRKRLPGEAESKYVGLTDINAAKNTTKCRLSKKLFNRKAMKRVAADMDKQDRKKFRDKYGDQFNYVFDH